MSSAWLSKPVDRDEEVRLAAEADLGADAERYRVDIDGPKARLVHAEAAFVPRVSLDGGFELNVTEGLVAAFARGRSTADVSGLASGTLHADLAQRRADIKASARAHGDGWEALDPRLADLGALDLTADVDADLDHENLSVRMADAVLRSAAQGEVLRLAALQPLRFGLEDWLVEPDKPAEPALRFAMANLPLAWFQRFVPAAQIDGGRLSGTLEVVRDGERTTVLAAQPIKVTGIALRPIKGIEASRDRRDARAARDARRRCAHGRRRGAQDHRAHGSRRRVQRPRDDLARHLARARLRGRLESARPARSTR